jgi:hypothetical protein
MGGCPGYLSPEKAYTSSVCVATVRFSNAARGLQADGLGKTFTAELTTATVLYNCEPEQDAMAPAEPGCTGFIAAIPNVKQRSNRMLRAQDRCSSENEGSEVSCLIQASPAHLYPTG